MVNALAISVSALAALIPASIVGVRGQAPPGVFWLVLAVAVAGPATLAVIALSGPWHGSFWITLWVSVAGTMVIFAGLAVFEAEARRLMPLLLPYLLVLGLVATVWSRSADPGPAGEPSVWLGVHVAVAIATYALVTLAAIAGLAVLLQESALKRRRPTRLTRSLPSIVDSERLELRLLVASEAVLGAGLLTGMALQHTKSGHVLELDHKTLFTVLAFAVIAALLIVRQASGLRGRRAARWVLAAYLLLSLGFIGVTFVTDVVLN